MKGKHVLLAVLCLAPTGPVLAEWTSGWGMGTAEYAVTDGNLNELIISCPSDSAISASATIMGQRYDSDQQPGFDVIVDGEEFTNPFFTDCRVCVNIFSMSFWEAFRNANNLKLVANGQTINLPTTNLKEILPPLTDPANACQSAW